MTAPALSPAPLPTSLVAVGGDPGTSTGLVALEVPIEVPRIGPPRFNLAGCHVLAHATVRASASAKLNRPGAHLSLLERCAEWIRPFGPAIVALEEPLDAAPGVWANATRAVGEAAQQRRETQFVLGSHYALLLAAVHLAAPGAAVESYPVGNFAGRPGWMTGGGKRVAARDLVLEDLARRARLFGAVGDLGEDVRMALGVLLFHLGRIDPPGVSRPDPAPRVAPVLPQPTPRPGARVVRPRAPRRPNP